MDADDAAVEVEARLMSIALILRLAAEHRYLDRKLVMLPLIGGQNIPPAS
jgi:hypothetical protein